MFAHPPIAKVQSFVWKSAIRLTWQDRARSYLFSQLKLQDPIFDKMRRRGDSLATLGVLLCVASSQVFVFLRTF